MRTKDTERHLRLTIDVDQEKPMNKIFPWRDPNKRETLGQPVNEPEMVAADYSREGSRGVKSASLAKLRCKLTSEKALY